VSDFFSALEIFHFLRPWALTMVPIALVLWWRIRQRATVQNSLTTGFPAHIARALKVGKSNPGRILAIDGVTATVILAALAAAGPAWSRIPNPLIAQTAPLAVVIKVSESMLQVDVQPNRLERAKHKILDVVEARAGGRTALIAYAGSAHRVSPLTEDVAVLKPFLEGLSPDIMPRKGANAIAALELAMSALATEQVPGAILFVLDELDQVDLAAFQRASDKVTPGLVFLAIGSSKTALRDLTDIAGAVTIAVTPDGSDVVEIERRIASAFRDALAQDDRLQWEDRGWMLVWPAVILMLLWFRRGWTMRWNLVLAVLLTGMAGQPAHADGMVDWFLTSDQQGRLAYDNKEYVEASVLFRDPVWNGYALYRAGKYTEAAQVFARVDTAKAAFSQGMSHIKAREYRDGIRAFETALKRDPGYADATRNLEIARAIVTYVESAREQSDTGEELGIGADDVVFDNESNRGAETEITGDAEPEMVTAAQWMRTVDTRTPDFLRIRFALEVMESAQ